MPAGCAACALHGCSGTPRRTHPGVRPYWCEFSCRRFQAPPHGSRRRATAQGQSVAGQCSSVSMAWSWSMSGGGKVSGTRRSARHHTGPSPASSGPPHTPRPRRISAISAPVPIGSGFGTPAGRKSSGWTGAGAGRQRVCRRSPAMYQAKPRRLVLARSPPGRGAGVAVRHPPPGRANPPWRWCCGHRRRRAPRSRPAGSCRGTMPAPSLAAAPPGPAPRRCRTARRSRWRCAG